MGELKVAVAHDRDSIDYDVALQTVELHQKVSGLHTLAAPDLSRQREASWTQRHLRPNGCRKHDSHDEFFHRQPASKR